MLLKQKEQSSRKADKFDDDLFDQFKLDSLAVYTRVAVSGLVNHAVGSLRTYIALKPIKRRISEIVSDSERSIRLKRSKISALALVGDIGGGFMTNKAAKRRILMTSESLCTASHNLRTCSIW